MGSTRCRFRSLDLARSCRRLSTDTQDRSIRGRRSDERCIEVRVGPDDRPLRGRIVVYTSLNPDTSSAPGWLDITLHEAPKNRPVLSRLQDLRAAEELSSALDNVVDEFVALRRRQ